jgi:hypothetical protein
MIIKITSYVTRNDIINSKVHSKTIASLTNKIIYVIVKLL